MLFTGKSSKTRIISLCFGLLFIVFAQTINGQVASFPYSISVTAVPGNCYDDCRIIIKIHDGIGNEVLINPQTHNAQNPNLYPLYNVQYYYRNVSAGTNVRYDTLNNIPVTSGIYCVGVIGHVPVNTPDGLDYVMVDTSVCNVEVSTNYDHMEASVLSSQARNDFELYWDENNTREFCGWRPSFSCADRGRIQLKIIKGKFPYSVLILDSNQDTLRNLVFNQRQQFGEDSMFADYRDFYTFDQIPVGDYSIRVSDSCDYAQWLSISIPDAHPIYYDRYCQNNINCPDSNVVFFQFCKNGSVGLHDYDRAYFDSVLQYRFINPGGDTTEWYSQSYNIWDPNWSYISDTLSRMRNYCDLYNDTIFFQIRDLCHDTIYTSAYFYTKDFIIYDEMRTTSFEMVTSPDTCLIHTLSGLMTQTYNYYGDPWWCGGCAAWNDNITWAGDVHGRFYTCPLSYDIWSSLDSTLVAHNESDDFSWLSAPVTYTVDTIIPVHITVTDAKGCQLTSLDTVFTFNVTNASDLAYPYITNDVSHDYGWMGCCWDRYVYIRQDINADLYRKNMTVQLVESPLYNHFNLTATCQNGEWSFTPEDPNNHHTYAEFSMGDDGWQVTIRDSVCLSPGRYTFVVTSPCGIDTVTHITSDTWYKDSLSMDTLPTYDKTQICDKLIVHQTPGIINVHRFGIDLNINNDDLHEQIWQTGYETSVVNGVAGGYTEWPDGNGNFIFSIPGQYVIETRSWADCEYLNHYDTIEYVPVYIEFDQGFAILCDNLSNTGFVSTHAINGSAPYTYYLFDQPDMMGSIIGTSDVGRFPLVPMVAGQQFSVMVEDSCHNSFYINLTATPINQSALAWEFGNFSGRGHCEGDSIHLAALPFAFDVFYQWYGPNGFSSNDRVNHIYIPYGSEGGYYTLEVLNTGCETRVMDSVYIEVIKAPTVTILSDTTVCSGDGVTLGFQVQGNSPVTFDIIHSGAPSSGSNTFTANPGSTIFQHYPIESDNHFWTANISDSQCAYDYIIDTVCVSLYNAAVSPSPSVIGIDGYACYNHTASLRASSSIPTPYYVYWFQDDRQQNLLQCDTIFHPSNSSTLYVNNVVGDTTVFVTIANGSQCRATYGAINHLVNMCNGTTSLVQGEGARFYDSGGEQGNYGDSENLIHTFNCAGATSIDLIFNSVDLAIGDTLYVYAGATITPSALLASLSQNSSLNTLLVNQSAVTFRFNSSWANNRGGWNIDVFTAIPMTPVSAHVSPLNYDTVAAVVCTSETPYYTPYFPPLDISQPTAYLIDSLITSGDGCQTYVHLDVLVNPVSHTELHDSLMPCQLPITWNGLTFSDYGTQTLTLTNMWGCDSVVSMMLQWAPPIDSTVVFDTIVENQLPYHINGLIFNEPGVQIATLQNQSGCDSVVTVHLFVHYNVSAEADTVICDNDLPFVWNDVTFTREDTLAVVLIAHTGADSTLMMRVMVNPTSHTMFKDTTCQNSAYDNYGFSLSEKETTIPGLTTLFRTENNVFGCDSVVELQLFITPVIIPDFFAVPDKAILTENPDIHFTNNTDISELENMNYIWSLDFGDGNTDTIYDSQVTHVYTQWGDFSATLTLTVNDCVSEYSIPIIIEANLEFPNVLTPNGDGINDVFIIKGLNPERQNRLVIVDRWGKTVLVQNNYQTYMKEEQVYNADQGFGMGIDVPDGVYYFTFYYEGAVRTVKYNGSITVIK